MLRTNLNLLLQLLQLVFLICFASSYQACNRQDREALLSINFNTSSPPLNWPYHTDCCLWEGIKCDVNGRVTHVWLPGRGMRGQISPHIGNLTHLSHLNLSHNSLSGPLPYTFVPTLIRLEILDLSYNKLSGEFPSSLSSNYIRLIDLSSNYFHGIIPSSFFQLSNNLVSFNVSNNSFTGFIPSTSGIDYACSVSLLDFSFNDFNGQIPTGLGNCSKLQTFRTGFNYISGLLPDDIYSATSLEELSLPFNHLSGSISDSIIQLRNLTILELYRNQFTGLIPKDIGKLTNLKHLHLADNSLSGSLPPSMANCINLITLILRFNNFEGNISAFNFSMLHQLRALDLGHNNFTGSFPLTLTSCKLLTAVRLAVNNLQGKISPDLVALDSLSYLSLADNNFTDITSAIKILMSCKNLRVLFLSGNFKYEAIPDDDQIEFSDGFPNLQVLSLGSSLINRQVPPWIGKLQKLTALDLSQNLISGSIPRWLGNLPSLSFIDLSSNFFSGEFPKELCGLPMLVSEEAHNQVDKSHLELPIFNQVPANISNYKQYNVITSIKPGLHLGNNSLSGSIPTEIGRLKLLHILDLRHNNFSGNIPNQMSQLTNLETLDLSGNYLSGEIPVSLLDLHFLSLFSVADNNLQGPIPSGGQFDTFPSSSFDGNPGLYRSVAQRPSILQPNSTSLSVPRESSNKELHFGLIAGGTFGFIIGCTIGILIPLRRFKFAQNSRLWQIPF